LTLVFIRWFSSPFSLSPMPRHPFYAPWEEACDIQHNLHFSAIQQRMKSCQRQLVMHLSNAQETLEFSIFGSTFCIYDVAHFQTRTSQRSTQNCISFQYREVSYPYFDVPWVFRFCFRFTSLHYISSCFMIWNYWCFNNWNPYNLFIITDCFIRTQEFSNLLPPSIQHCCCVRISFSASPDQLTFRNWYSTCAPS
jgi:hypothetical protein